jgi:hypothetical protein
MHWNTAENMHNFSDPFFFKVHGICVRMQASSIPVTIILAVAS